MNLVYEPKKIIDVTKSQATFKRALNCIPAGIYGHLGPSEGCMVPVSSYPLYMDHAQGAYIYDIDGNRIIDYMCGYGPNYLGYNDPDVDAAAAAHIGGDLRLRRDDGVEHRLFGGEGQFRILCRRFAAENLCREKLAMSIIEPKSAPTGTEETE